MDQNPAWEQFTDDNKVNHMKIISIFANLLILVGLSSCGITTLSKSDSRFALILGKTIQIKNPIFLYEIDSGLTGDSSRFPVSGAKYDPADVVGVLGVGHPVVFEAVETSRDLGAYSQHLVGYTDFESKRFPITYFIGIGGDDWKKEFAYDFTSPLFDKKQ